MILIEEKQDMPYLIFDLGEKGQNEAEFNKLNESINAGIGYPNEFGTKQYSTPIYHPTGTQVAIEVLDTSQVKDFLSQDQKIELVDKLPDDWIPKEE